MKKLDLLKEIESVIKSDLKAEMRSLSTQIVNFSEELFDLELTAKDYLVKEGQILRVHTWGVAAGLKESVFRRKNGNFVEAIRSGTYCYQHDCLVPEFIAISVAEGVGYKGAKSVSTVYQITEEQKELLKVWHYDPEETTKK